MKKEFYISALAINLSIFILKEIDDDFNIIQT